MNKLFSLLLSVLIGYGALKGYLYYDVKHALEAVISKAEPYLQIEYRDFKTAPLDGLIIISDIKITPVNNRDGISIERLTIKGLEFYPPFAKSASLFNFEKPNVKQLSLEGVSNKSDSFLFSNLIQRSAPSKFKVNWASQNILLDKLGYSTIMSNVLISLTPLPEKKQMQVSYTQINRDMFTLQLNFLVDLPSEQSYKLMQIHEGTLTYQDHSLFKKWLNANAKTNQLSDKAMQQKFLHDLNAQLSNQIILDQSALAAIEQFLANPSSLSIRIQPNDPLNLDALNMLRLYKASDIPKILNLQVTYQ
ncbi:MAG: hypothetical protein U1E78_02700 [Gammaproteobacteria bacterium]